MLRHVVQGGIASRSKRQRTSRLGGAKKKVDRLNYLFEAIEADKASDSDTAHGTDSRGSQGEESDSARPLHHGIGDMRGEEAGPSGVPAAQLHSLLPSTASSANTVAFMVHAVCINSYNHSCLR